MTVVVAACAFFGTRFSYDQDVTGAVFSTSAVVFLIAAAEVYFRTRYRCRREAELLEQEINDERAALSMGRRARTIYLSVIGRDGQFVACPLAQILTDVVPEGGRVEWRYPYHVQLRYAQRNEVGGHNDGEAS
jgi:hypothetical protein